MTDADGPRSAVRIAAGDVEIPAGVDRIVLQRTELTRRHIDRQAFRNSSQIENQRAQQRDRLLIRIEENISIADRAGGAGGIDIGSNRVPAAVLAVEPAGFHRVTDGGIKCTVALLCHRHCKLDGFVEKRADGDRYANPRREQHHFALRVEPRATFLDAAKPRESALDACSPIGNLLRIRSVTDDLDRHARAHQHDGPDVDLRHPISARRRGPGISRWRRRSRFPSRPK